MEWSLVGAGIDIPIHFTPGEGGGGGSGSGSGGSGGIVNAAYHPDGGGAFGGIRRASGGGGAIPGRNAFGGVDPLAGGTAVEPDGISRSGGSRSWRNNNPGNIEFGPFARSMGAIGTDGRFARFPSYEAGRHAQEALLFESKGYRDRNLPGAIRRWAPGSENNVPAYIRAMGAYDPNKRMQDYTPAERARLLDAMQQHEGWRPGRAAGGRSATGERAASAHSDNADLFPDGTPRVLKPDSMPDAPGMTMKEYMRSRGPTAATVPEAPVGGGTSVASDMHAAADRMHDAAGRMEDMTVRTHHTIELTGSGRDAARVKQMRRYNDGPVRGNVGVSMPHVDGSSTIT